MLESDYDGPPKREVGEKTSNKGARLSTEKVYAGSGGIERVTDQKKIWEWKTASKKIPSLLNRGSCTDRVSPPKGRGRGRDPVR